jgi:signal transduction histidine kinase/DNA-binding response OmpR family regulator/HPt (histidine-containing phosphotransfer) domain-containing protein
MVNQDTNDCTKTDMKYAYDIMDGQPEEEFDVITKLASRICDSPICLITLIDGKRLWLKSNQGLLTTALHKDKSFCETAIAHGSEFFEVYDASVDDRFKDNSYTLLYPFVRHYAAMPLVIPSGYTIGTLCIVDTKPKRLTEGQKLALITLGKQVIVNMELKWKNKELQRLAQIKEEFFSNMSHEIRTPMNAINGFADLIMKTRLNKEQTDMIKIIKSSTDVLIALVNDILDFSKINSGKLTLDSQTFNLKETLRATTDLLKGKAADKCLSFKKDNINIPDFVKGDKIRLSQILTNLIGNAIKFTSRGSITLRSELIETTDSDCQVKFDVIDTGIGIAEEKLGMIFERYEQANSDTHSKYGGTGLGLSIVKSLIELQGGNIEVQSTVNKGTTFTFTLKFQIPTEKERTDSIGTLLSSKNLTKPSLRGMRILLAEDTEINVKLIKKVLEGTYCTLDCVVDGKLCVQKLRSQTYDLVLMDLQMPHMDGYETTKTIRKVLKLDLPIIALTANVSFIDKEKCLSIGMNDYLTKPFRSKDLYNTINKYYKHRNTLKKYTLSKKVIKSTPVQDHKIDLKFTSPPSGRLAPRKKTSLSIEKFGNGKLKQVKLTLKHLSGLSSVNNNNFETINLNVLKEYIDGDEDLMRNLISQMLKDFPSYLVELKEGVINKNFVNIKNIAHKLKSPLAMLGMEMTRNMLKTIEDFASVKDIKSINEKYLLCKNNIERCLKDMSCYK